MLSRSPSRTPTASVARHARRRAPPLLGRRAEGRRRARSARSPSSSFSARALVGVDVELRVVVVARARITRVRTVDPVWALERCTRRARRRRGTGAGAGRSPRGADGPPSARLSTPTQRRRRVPACGGYVAAVVRDRRPLFPQRSPARCNAFVWTRTRAIRNCS